MNSAIDALSECLKERTFIFKDGDLKGKYIVYWMKNAVRAHENPALDVAIKISEQLSLPLLVFQEISEDEPYASDRRFMFEIEGARDVQEELARHSIDYFFWIQRRDQKHLLTEISNKAALVVAEDMPVPSERAAKQRLADASGTAIWLVDTACIVPMQHAGKAYTRAFAYRQATAKERSRRLKAEYEEIEFRPAQLPIGTIKESRLLLKTLDLNKILSSLDIDHELSPIRNTTGGSTSGYARWQSFLEKQLPHYARDRNDPLLDPSSRMSPYLRLGQVSPFRIAREAASSHANGAYKFLDELLVWRELSYTFCRFTPKLETLEAIPSWAVQSLHDHESDKRSHLYTYDELFFAKTTDPLWNAAQLSLLLRGELHNNVRMTWGKAFLKWTKDAQTALAHMISLNHRLALDGNDPSSYGGLLWCLGQFDRPFPPEKPVLGLVRDRSTTQHAYRLNVEKYLASIQ